MGRKKLQVKEKDVCILCGNKMNNAVDISHGFHKICLSKRMEKDVFNKAYNKGE